MADCNDIKCAVHGSLKVRGNVFTGKVISAKPTKTVVVEREIVHYVPKYERYKKVRSKVYAHNPLCMNASEGDIVRIGETRKLSKTKAFVVMNIEKKAERKEVKLEEISEFVRKKKPVENKDEQTEAV